MDEPARHTYRRLHNIPDELGHGGERAGDGIRQYGRQFRHRRRFYAQSLDRREELYGEFLINAQGEDVVAGIRTPQEISEASRKEAGSDKPSMEYTLPKAYAELERIYNVLERHYRDMQDLEFTVEQGKLWMLQTRSGKRTAKAALGIAVELANEGLISKGRCGVARRSVESRSVIASDN